MPPSLREEVVTDKHFREWEQEAFGFGYGTGEAYILPILSRFFRALTHGVGSHNAGHYDAERLAAQLGDAHTWFLLNVLCRMDVIAYGTSPQYGWLTTLGQRLFSYVRVRTPHQLYAIVTQDGEPAQPLCSRTSCHCPDGSDTQGCQHNPLFVE
jgi:hypothetical protein